MCQDRHGVIWIGSCDGLNIYDGTYLGLYKPTNVHHSFSGNLIERIIEADNDVLWIQTNYGLDRFDTRRQTIQSFKDFKYINRMAKMISLLLKMMATFIIISRSRRTSVSLM